MHSWGSKLYVVLNSYSTEYSTNSSQTDIYYYQINAWNGYTTKHVKYGSPMDDTAFDIQVNQGGIYILAEINDDFRPHRDNSYEWATERDRANLVLMWLNFDNEIINIEGYDVELLEEPHPRKFMLNRYEDHTN